MRAGACPLLFWSFLKVSPVERERRVFPGSNSWSRERVRWSEVDPPLPRFLLGPIAWHGAYGTALSSSRLFHLELRAEIEARKFFVGEQGPFWVRV